MKVHGMVRIITENSFVVNLEEGWRSVYIDRRIILNPLK